MFLSTVLIVYIIFDVYMTLHEELMIRNIRDNLGELDELLSNYETI